MLPSGGVAYQFALNHDKAAAVGADDDDQDHSRDRQYSSGSDTSSTPSFASDTPMALQRSGRRVLQLHGEMVYLPQKDALLFAGIPLLRSLEQMQLQGVGLESLPVHSHGRELMFSSLYQSVSALHATAAAANMKESELQRAAIEQEKEVTSKLLHSILPPVRSAVPHPGCAVV
jgi:hypothetical protein